MLLDLKVKQYRFLDCWVLVFPHCLVQAVTSNLFLNKDLAFDTKSSDFKICLVF